jgi:hypothetical protein
VSAAEDATTTGVVEEVASSCTAEVVVATSSWTADVVATPSIAEVATLLAEAITALPLADGAAGALGSSALTQPVFAVMAAGQATCVNDTVGLSAPMNQSKRQ